LYFNLGTSLWVIHCHAGKVEFLTATLVEVSNILLTVLGFVVGLALSFRSSTAYER
jgi:predicted membrane chloride channel (bestrophin family)